MPNPAISAVAPTPGSALGPQTPVTFQVTSGTGLLRVFVTATYPGIGITEVVHDGTAFGTAYRSTSSRSAIAGGFQYSLYRSPAWPDAPTLGIYADDTGGLETVASFAWILAMPPPLPAPGAIVPVFPVAGAASQVSVVKHDQAYYLAVFDRNLSSTWLFPLKTYPNSGYELLQMYAKIGERLSTAIANLEQGNVIMFASGGSFTTALVEFVRPSADAGAVTIAAGTVVTTSNGGRDFTLTSPASFGLFDVGPITANAIAASPGWQWNVKGVVITARGETLLGEIDTVRSFVQVANPIPIATGQDGSAVVAPGVANTGTARFLFVYVGGAFLTAGQLLYDNGTSTGYMEVIDPQLGWTVQLSASFPPSETYGAILLLPNVFLALDTASIWQVISDPTQSPTFIDATITVQQIVDAQGGADPMLDGLGADRGEPRKPGESDQAYRLRIRTLPDTISPDAVLRNVQNQLGPYGVSWSFEETWDIRYQTCWDAPSPNKATPTYYPVIDPASPQFNPNYNPQYDNTLFAYDDSLDEFVFGLGPKRPAYDPTRMPPDKLPFYNRWLDDVEDRGAFIIVVPNYPAITDCGLGYDDTAAGTAGLETVIGTVIGHRGTGAYDVPSSVDPTLVFPAGYDGFDLGKQGVYLSVWQLLQSMKAAGVAGLVELQGQ